MGNKPCLKYILETSFLFFFSREKCRKAIIDKEKLGLKRSEKNEEVIGSGTQKHQQTQRLRFHKIFFSGMKKKMMMRMRMMMWLLYKVTLLHTIVAAMAEGVVYCVVWLVLCVVWCKWKESCKKNLPPDLTTQKHLNQPTQPTTSTMRFFFLVLFFLCLSSVVLVEQIACTFRSGKCRDVLKKKNVLCCLSITYLFYMSLYISELYETFPL